MARPRSDIEPRIVHAARQRFLMHGVDGASLRQIARDAGTNIGMVYYYFPTKKDLLLAVVEEVYVGVLDDMRDALAPDAPATVRIERLYARLALLSDDETAVVRLILREVLLGSSLVNPVLERLQRGHIPMVFETLHAGKEEGDISSEHHPMMLMLCVFLIGGFPQIIGRQLAGHPLFDGMPKGDELAKQLAKVFFYGVGPQEK